MFQPLAEHPSRESSRLELLLFVVNNKPHHKKNIYVCLKTPNDKTDQDHKKMQEWSKSFVTLISLTQVRLVGMLNSITYFDNESGNILEKKNRGWALIAVSCQMYCSISPGKRKSLAKGHFGPFKPLGPFGKQPAWEQGSDFPVTVHTIRNQTGQPLHFWCFVLRKHWNHICKLNHQFRFIWCKWVNTHTFIHPIIQDAFHRRRELWVAAFLFPLLALQTPFTTLTA